MKHWAIAGCAVASLAVSAAAPAASTAPTLTMQSLTIKREKPRDGFAGTVSLRVRICLSVGPKAQLVTAEARTAGSAVKAKGTSIEPLGVDLTKISAFACTSNYLISWAVRSRFLVGGGTYAATIRLRDGYGRVSAPLAFGVRL